MQGETNKQLARKIEQILAPFVQAEGYELVWLELIARRRLLRLYVDHHDGVNLDGLTHLSRYLSDIMDGEQIMEKLGELLLEGYTLEVSSPGLDRPLIRPEHFMRFVGQQVQVTTTDVVNARREKITGVLLAADSEGIALSGEGGQTRAMPYAQVTMARLVAIF